MEVLGRLSDNTLTLVGLVVTVVIGVIGAWAAIAPSISFEARTMRDATMVGILKDQGHEALAARVQRRMDRRIERWSRRKLRIVSGMIAAYSLVSSAVVVISVHTKYYAWSDYVSAFNATLAAVVVTVLRRRGNMAIEEKEASEQPERPSPQPDPKVRPRLRTLVLIVMIALIKWR